MFKYIFYKNRNVIYTFHFRDGKFEIVREMGEVSKNFNEDEFWRWWKRKSSYNREVVDLCILSDQEFLPTYLSDAGINLQGKNSWKSVEINAFTKFFWDEYGLKFDELTTKTYFFPLKDNQTKETKKHQDFNITSDESVTPFASFFLRENQLNKSRKDKK